MPIVVKGRCPYYRYREDLGKVSSCDGDVIFEDNVSYGTCQTCKREVPIIIGV